MRLRIILALKKFHSQQEKIFKFIVNQVFLGINYLLSNYTRQLIYAHLEIWHGGSTREIVFRWPSCMAISWSYVRQIFHFVEKGRHTPFLKKKQLFAIHIYPVVYPVISLVIRSVIRPVICWVIWCFPIWLPNQFIKLSDAIFSANEIRTFLLKGY